MQTVENFFDLSFLVKEKHIEVSADAPSKNIFVRVQDSFHKIDEQGAGGTDGAGEARTQNVSQQPPLYVCVPRLRV